MSQIFTLAKRELGGLFYSPIGYIVLALYLLFVGLLFSLMVLRPGQIADPGPMFLWNHLILIFLVPFMTMAIFSEEYRSGRIETLRTSPLGEMSIVLGKFLGAMGFYLGLIGSSLAFVIILSFFGRPDYMPVLTSYLGLVLMGGADGLHRSVFFSLHTTSGACRDEFLHCAGGAGHSVSIYTTVFDSFYPAFLVLAGCGEAHDVLPGH